MDINREALDVLYRNWIVAWDKGYGWEPPLSLDFMTTEFGSTTASNFYAWLDLMPQYREWIGDRVFNNVRSHTDEIINRDWEQSVSMPAKDLDDDQNFGVYAKMVEMMGVAWPQLMYDLVVAVLVDNTTAFTGQGLASNSHTYGDYTIDNLTTDALSTTSFEAAFTDSASWQFANGVYIKPRWTHLLYGPKLAGTAFDLIDNKYVTTGSGSGGNKENRNYKRVIPVEVPDFIGAADDYWALLDCHLPIKPVALQKRKLPVPLMDTDPAHVARTGQVDFMADGRAAAGPTLPHLVYMGRL